MTSDQDPFVEPPTAISDPDELIVGFLDCYRETLLRKVAGLTDDEMRASRLPSGWSPLGLVRHLTFVERRWLRWGFLAMDFDGIWGDTDPQRPDGPWPVPESMSVTDVLDGYRAEIALCRRVPAEHAMSERGRAGGRFDEDQPVPTLGWIMLHLIQEYARHVGHLDVVRELIDGTVGE
ncbi:MAG: DinB family protein [Actinocatenispora sp.]